MVAVKLTSLGLRVSGRDRHAHGASQGRPHRPRGQPHQRGRALPPVFVGRAKIGAAWPKRSAEGRDYLSVKLDDPSFNAPIFANLFDGEDDNYNLIWSRGRRQNRE
jgi:hypothetical protein